MTDPTELDKAIERLEHEVNTTMYDDQEFLKQDIVTVLSAAKRVPELERQLKEYSESYDRMVATHKDEKRDIAKRCGFPWDLNDCGLEPWNAADELRKIRDQWKEMAMAFSLYAKKFNTGHYVNDKWQPYDKDLDAILHKYNTVLMIEDNLSNPRKAAIQAKDSIIKDLKP